MFNKKIIIDFVADNKEFLEIADKPPLASKNTPTWFKNTTAYVNGIKGIDTYSDPTSTIKKCMPVVDSMGAGYNITLPCDLWVINEGERKIKFQWAWDKLSLISEQRADQYSTYPIPQGFYDVAFKFLNHWIVKTPKNYSCLFTHPLHYDDLPFRCLPAIVDTDKFPIPVHFPFFLRKDFSGLIPKGTPIIQIIPFKRQTFRSRYSWDKGELLNIWKKAHNTFFDRYLKNFRTPKIYEEGETKKSKCPFH